MRQPARWTEADVSGDWISIEFILTKMKQAGASVKILIIDASRRNPSGCCLAAGPEGIEEDAFVFITLDHVALHQLHPGPASPPPRANLRKCVDPFYIG